MQLTQTMNSEGADLYYDSNFRSVLEDHVPLLKNEASTELITVNPSTAYKFEYDLCGYLASIDIPHHLHWITMRVNGWNKDTDFYNPSTIRIPHRTSVDRIKQMYETSTTNK
tara:strand:+ start:646 stop:981 length:336 start_codon:yes stop_codon:yes gene_type:complete